ncbi:DUF2892 domain-containing protein [Candidatus Thioglobus sp.]|nr:DUF2892 domain-containing protein [Candidatus Thioglobus sp.]MDB3971979.1 DUF2892 domain-containing protein [Candidatus Thioglobus sp.]MDC0388476.1 DUF2892 domain-containing protein [Candidatus Thioglobus sp.]MDC0407107.1 DUF2892 domain-containing protein [Candidatus Thioglobus sp.]MDC3265956.1 DUF2892 domain-containing protein [Candidatus Thioglobus sp.]
MNKNIGTTDKFLRLIVGIALVIATASGNLPLWGWVGVVLIATALVNFCLLYKIIGVNTSGDK